MKIRGKQDVCIEITPYNAAQALLDTALNPHTHEYIRVEDNVYSIWMDQSSSHYKYEQLVRVISKDEYDYIQALQVVVDYLRKACEKEFLLRREFEEFKKAKK